VIYSKCDGRFRVAALFLLLTLLLAALSSGLPNRQQNLSRPPDVAPSLAYPFGTNRTGRIVWWMAFAVRNSLMLGVITAIVSRGDRNFRRDDCRVPRRRDATVC
jgi:peptide/nickel transport system permease protein